MSKELRQKLDHLRRFQPYFLYQRSELDQLQQKYAHPTPAQRRRIAAQWKVQTPEEKQKWNDLAADMTYDAMRKDVVAALREDNVRFWKRHHLPSPSICPPSMDFTLIYKNTEFCVHKRTLEEKCKVFTIVAHDCKQGDDSDPSMQNSQNSIRLPENVSFSEEHVALFSAWLRDSTQPPPDLNHDNIIGMTYLCEWVDAPELRQLLDQQIASWSTANPDLGLRVCFELRYHKTTARLIHCFIDSFLSRRRHADIMEAPYNVIKKKFVDDAPPHWQKTMLECILYFFREKRLGRDDAEIEDYLNLPRKLKQFDEFQSYDEDDRASDSEGSSKPDEPQPMPEAWSLAAADGTLDALLYK